MAQTLAPKEIAAEIGVSAKTFRKFLRSDARTRAEKKGINTDEVQVTPGKGGRWEIARKDLPGLKRRFAAWQAVQAELRKQREEANAAETTEEVESDDEAETVEQDEATE